MVKMPFRIFGVILLTTIYCLAIAVTTGSSARSAYSVPIHSDQNNYFSVATTGLFRHTSPIEGSVNNFNGSTTPVCKISFDNLLTIVRIHDLLQTAQFSSYASTERSLLINSNQAKLIFPFHYFW